MRVLYVEDEPADARLLREVLADEPGIDIELHHVASLAEAGAALERMSFDVALLDLTLPDADGMTGLVAIQAMAPELPVVVLTGREDPAFAASMVKAGAQDYLQKAAMEPRTLERVLRYAVERKRTESHLRATSRELAATIAQLEQSRRSLALLNDMATMLQLQASLVEGVERVAEYLPRLLPGSSGRLEVGPASARASWGAPPPPGSAALEILPLRAQGREVGLIELCGAADEELVRVLVRQLGLSFHSIGFQADLFQQSVRDSLTGLFNRRYLLETAQRELRRSQRARRPLSLLFLDVDRFKAVNDRAGHDGGDAVLLTLAQLLADSFRVEDLVCRYGGEEFVIVLPDTDTPEAQRRAEDLRVAAKEMDFPKFERIGSITVSIGVATAPGSGTEFAVLLTAADRALYRAKQDGRDRVVVSPGLPAA